MVKANGRAAQTMTEATLGVNHVGVSVTDLQAAAQWYSTHLQFRLLKGPVHFKRDNAVPREKDAHIFKS
jgi:catechol 2,3-dioxygenase-like lactoylglutathione lyase family enzyme